MGLGVLCISCFGLLVLYGAGTGTVIPHHSILYNTGLYRDLSRDSEESWHGWHGCWEGWWREQKLDAEAEVE
jgi:hypothetical protein